MTIMPSDAGATALTRAVAFSSSSWHRRMGIVTVPVALDVGARSLHPSLHTTPQYFVGMLVLVVAWVLALLAHRRLGQGWAGWVIPVVVLAAIGLMRVVPELTGMGILVVFPALWLGVDKRWPGVALASVAVLLLQALPGVILTRADAATWVGSVQLCLVATICALTQAWIAEGWTSHESQLHVRQEQLTDSMRRLAAGQALNEAIMDAVDVGLLGLRADGTISAMNAQHRKFLDLAFPEGFRGRAGQMGWVFDADGLTLLKREQLPTVRAQHGEEFHDCLVWVGREPGERKALAVSAMKVEGDDDEVVSVLVFKDVTDLVRALRVKDEFVAMVSHELRTPLTSILGYLDLAALDVSPKDPRRGYLEVVQRNARRLLRLVNDLLVTAQTERGVLELDRHPVDLVRLVQESTDDLRGRAVEAGVDVVLDLQPGLWVSGDRDRLAEVVDNLVTNAVKYSHRGGAVRVRLTAAEAAGDAGLQAALTVSDDGIGIEEADRRQLFTKFFRAQEAQRRAIQGVGLGLSISKAIVTGHGGTIEVHSEPGVGTTFEVRLPMAAAPDAGRLQGLPDTFDPPAPERRAGPGGARVR